MLHETRLIQKLSQCEHMAHLGPNDCYCLSLPKDRISPVKYEYLQSLVQKDTLTLDHGKYQTIFLCNLKVKYFKMKNLQLNIHSR